MRPKRMSTKTGRFGYVIPIVEGNALNIASDSAILLATSYFPNKENGYCRPQIEMSLEFQNVDGTATPFDSFNLICLSNHQINLIDLSVNFGDILRSMLIKDHNESSDVQGVEDVFNDILSCIFAENFVVDIFEFDDNLVCVQIIADEDFTLEKCIASSHFENVRRSMDPLPKKES